MRYGTKEAVIKRSRYKMLKNNTNICEDSLWQN